MTCLLSLHDPTTAAATASTLFVIAMARAMLGQKVFPLDQRLQNGLAANSPLLTQLRHVGVLGGGVVKHQVLLSDVRAMAASGRLCRRMR